MDFFGMGPTELLLIFIVAMIFLGPSKIADLARQLGKAVYSFRKASSDLTSSVNKEMDQLKSEAVKSPYSHMPAPPNSPIAQAQSAHQISGASAPAKASEIIDSPGAGI